MVWLFTGCPQELLVFETCCLLFCNCFSCLIRKSFYINVFIVYRQIVLEALQQLVKLTHPELTNGKDEMETGDEKKELEGVSASSVCENVKKDLQKNGESEKIKLNGTHPSVPEGNSPKNSASINLEGKNKDCSLSDSDSYLTPHPILETHNYAKIPLIASTDPNNSSLAKAENR